MGKADAATDQGEKVRHVVGKRKASSPRLPFAMAKNADQVVALPRMAPNFWLNFRHGLAVSTIFCLPV